MRNASPKRLIQTDFVKGLKHKEFCDIMQFIKKDFKRSFMGFFDIFKKKTVVSQTMSKQQDENNNLTSSSQDTVNCQNKLDTKLYLLRNQWLKNEDVYDKFISLFVVKFEPYNTQQIGIWEPSNQPILIREKIDGHYTSHYSLQRILYFEEVRNYAEKSYGKVSVSARHFFEIDENNWRELADKAIGSFVDKAIDRKETEKRMAQKWRYSYLAEKDIKYNVDKTDAAETIDLMRTFLKDKNYDIVFSENKMTIVKHSDDPWNHFNKFIAKPDGIYNYVEVQMGGYDEKKRVSCKDFETACFLLLSMYVVREQKHGEDNQLIAEMKRYSDAVINNSADYWKGQFIIDELVSVSK